jgi:very-short-patch-repair endonuclease
VGVKMLSSKIFRDIARKLSKDITYAEKILWHTLQKKSLGVKFRRQHRIDHYIVDFYCSEIRFIIEVAGDVHELYNVKIKDDFRQAYLESKGFKILRIKNEDIISNGTRVYEKN